MRFVAGLFIVCSACDIAPIDDHLTPCGAQGECPENQLCQEGYCWNPPPACNKDGWRARNEQCDDGNTIDTDACTNTCRVARCGDGILRTDQDPWDPRKEECEPGLEGRAVRCNDNCRIAIQPRRLYIKGLGLCSVYSRMAHGDHWDPCVGENEHNDGDPGAIACLLEDEGITCFGHYNSGTIMHSANGVNEQREADWMTMAPTHVATDQVFDNLWITDHRAAWPGLTEPFIPRVSLTLTREQGEYEAYVEPSQNRFVIEAHRRQGFDALFSTGSTSYDRCWLRANGRLYCQGSNSCGTIDPRVGRTSTSLSQSFYWRDDLPPVRDFASNWDVACVALRDGRVACWGDMVKFGQQRLSEEYECQPQETTYLEGLEDVVAIDAHTLGMIALHRDGRISIWGWNYTNSAVEAPRELPMPAPAMAIGTAHRTGCALLETGQVACWGRHRGLEFGGPQVVIVPGLTDVTLLSRGTLTNQVCAQRSDRSVWCWGKGEFFGFHEIHPDGSYWPIQVLPAH